MNNNRGNNDNSDSNNNSFIVIRSTESQTFVLGFASENVAGASRRSWRPCHQALGTHPHVRLLRTPPNYHYPDYILARSARSEGRHLPDIAYYMKGGISRNESEGEQDTWEGKQVVAGYRRRSPFTR